MRISFLSAREAVKLRLDAELKDLDLMHRHCEQSTVNIRELYVVCEIQICRWHPELQSSPPFSI